MSKIFCCVLHRIIFQQGFAALPQLKKKLCSNTFAASDCDLKFENATQCCRRMRKREVATNHCNLFFRDKSQIGYKITVLGFKGAIYLSGFSN